MANIGDDVLHEGLKAGYGATIGVDSVRKLVDAVVHFQETSLQEIEQLRGQATRDSAEIAEYVEQGKQRFAALLQAPRARSRAEVSATMAPAELQDALLTMDVVDQLRYRNAEMKALADSGHDKATLKQRLLELYRSQGIEVSDEILEAGIQAQREQRYLYTAPRGWKAWLARRWIDRARLLKWALLAAFLLLVLGMLLFHARSFGAFVHESNVQKNVQVLNDKVAAQQQEAAAARALLAAQEQALQGLLPRATASGGRLQPLAEGAQAALAEAQRRIAGVPAALAAQPTLVRKDKLTRLSSGGSATGEQGRPRRLSSIGRPPRSCWRMPGKPCRR